MKAVITGGSGRVGRALAARLASAGWEVVVAARSAPQPTGSASMAPRWLALSIEEDASVAALTAELGPEVALIHLAAGRPSAGVNASDERRRLLGVNVLGTQRVLEAARSGVKAVVYASTYQVYGHSELARPLREGDPVRPLDDYAVTKLAGEDLLIAFGEEQRTRVVALRFGSSYGDGTAAHDGVSALLQAALRGEPVHFAGPAHEISDQLHVSDAARSIELALAREVHGIFNVSDGVLHTRRALASAVLSTLGLPSVAEAHAGEGTAAYPGLDIARARRELGFEPSVALVEGLREELTRLRSAGAV